MERSIDMVNGSPGRDRRKVSHEMGLFVGNVFSPVQLFDQYGSPSYGPYGAAQAYYVDTVDGAATNDGKSWDSAFSTMALALAAVQTGGRVYFRGDVREQLTGDNLKFDISIIGCGTLHHPDVPGTGYHPGASCWRPPASPAAATPLLKVRGRGWQFHNIMFDCPSDAAALYLENNSGSGLTEYDASHIVVANCGFMQGKTGIQCGGPIGNARILDNWFAILSETSGCALYAATDGGPHYRWQIKNNFFVPAATTEGNKGNQSHIDLALTSGLIEGNFFGTVEATGKYIDLTGGQDNMVVGNYLMGTYAAADYVAATGDCWYGNRCAVTETTAPDGVSLVAPA
jgi:hypothetical protein